MFGQSKPDNNQLGDDMQLAAGQFDDLQQDAPGDDSFLGDLSDMQPSTAAAGQAANTDGQSGHTDAAWQHPGAPLDNPAVSAADSQTGNDTAAAPPSDQPASGPEEDINKLIDIKQQALGQLSPLVGHLDQTPEEKFHTTMMMIRASDDQSLIKTAYEAAQQISDEKVRAQALLDIVNEINYFTQQKQ